MRICKYVWYKQECENANVEWYQGYEDVLTGRIAHGVKGG